MTTKSMLKTTVALLLVCVPALFLFNVFRPRVRGANRIVLSPSSVEVKRHSDEKEEVEQTVLLELENLTDSEVTILRASSSCGCTVPSKIAGRQIPPHSQLSFPVNAKIPSHGEKDVIVAIETSDPVQPIVQSMLVLKGIPIALPRVVSQPKEVSVVVAESVINKGIQESLSFTLEEVRGDTPALSGCAGQETGIIDSSIALVDEKAGDNPENVYRRYSVQLNVLDAGMARLRSSNRLYVRVVPQFNRDVNFLPQHIPVSVKVTPDVIARPSSIVFRTSPSDRLGPEKKKIVIEWAKGVLPRLAKDVRSSQPWIKGVLASGEDQRPGEAPPEIALMVVMTDQRISSGDAFQNEWVEVEFDGDLPPLKIPVYLDDTR